MTLCRSVVAAWPACADHLAGAVLRPTVGAVALQPASAGPPDGDFIDVDLLVDGGPPAGPPVTRRLRVALPSAPRAPRMPQRDSNRCPPGWCCSTAGGARRATMPRPSAIGRATPAGAMRWCRTFAAAPGELNLSPRAYHSGRLRRDRLDPAAAASAQCRAPQAVGISLGGNALLRWAEEVAAAAAHTARAVAASACRSTCRRRVSPSGAASNGGPTRDVPAPDEAQGAGCWRSIRLFDRERAARRGTSTSSTTFPRRFIGLRDTDDTGARPARSRTCPRSAFRPWCSTPATTHSCPAVTAPDAPGRPLARQPRRAARRISGGWFPGHVRDAAPGRDGLDADTGPLSAGAWRGDG